LLDPDKNTARPRLVLLDLGNVLVSLRPLAEAFPQEVARAGRRDPEAALVAFKRSSVFDRFERGRAKAEEFYRGMREFFQVDLSDESLREGYNRLLGDEIDGMLPVVEDIKRAGMRAAALTDTSPIHLAVLDRYAVVRALEAVIASCETGLKKPDPEAFREAARRLGVAPGEVYFTDDLVANVEGAREAGLRAEVFRGPEDLRRKLGLRAI